MEKPNCSDSYVITVHKRWFENDDFEKHTHITLIPSNPIMQSPSWESVVVQSVNIFFALNETQNLPLSSQSASNGSQLHSVTKYQLLNMWCLKCCRKYTKVQWTSLFTLPQPRFIFPLCHAQRPLSFVIAEWVTVRKTETFALLDHVVCTFTV